MFWGFFWGGWGAWCFHAVSFWLQAVTDMSVGCRPATRRAKLITPPQVPADEIQNICMAGWWQDKTTAGWNTGSDETSCKTKQTPYMWEFFCGNATLLFHLPLPFSVPHDKSKHILQSIHSSRFTVGFMTVSMCFMSDGQFPLPVAAQAGGRAGGREGRLFWRWWCSIKMREMSFCAAL